MVVKSTPIKILKSYFKYSNFRPGQLDIITSILNRRDTLAILPTGGGKSICYQVPGLILSGTTLVISPLISLMKDQVDQLQKRGIVATFINSSLQLNEVDQRMSCLSKGEIKFCYVAPERLNNSDFVEVCQKILINLIVIDEAHCISEWGHDFRPSYLSINKFIDKLNIRPTVAAFTATATDKVSEDIKTTLKLKNSRCFTQGFYRPNLNFSVINCETNYQKEVWLFRILKNNQDQSGIIYTSTRDSSEYLVKLLQHFNIHALSYHGGLDQEQRSLIQDMFIADKISLIVATNAFGMGIDKSNVRFVIHYQLPSSIENYYQEAGRAGRDGLSSNCYLLFCPRDINIVQNLIQPQPTAHKTNQWLVRQRQLKKMIGYAATNDCRVKYINQYFNSNEKIVCRQCDKCEQRIINCETENNVLNRLKKFSYHQSGISYHQLQQISLHQPQSLAEILKLPGWGTGLNQRWGQKILKDIR